MSQKSEKKVGFKEKGQEKHCPFIVGSGYQMVRGLG